MNSKPRQPAVVRKRLAEIKTTEFKMKGQGRLLVRWSKIQITKEN